MLYQYIRTFDADDGTLTDLSLDNQDESSTLPFDLVFSEDYYYIAQFFPFNNFFVQIDTANDVTASITLEYYDGTSWREAVDVLDGTSTSGVSLAKSGVIQFSPNNSFRWARTVDTTDSTAPTALNSITTYNMYWLRMKFSDTLKVTTAIKRITYAFTLHQQIDNLDTTVDEYLTDFVANKTSWNDEIVTCSMQVVADLKRKGLILNVGQILVLEDVSMATDWKTLMHIYRNLGGDYKTKFDAAKIEYDSALDLKRFTFDKDNDAFIDRNEIAESASRLRRT